MERETILDRIRKLKALASSSNPHEAALAASLAQKLMMRHHLEEHDLGVEPEAIRDYGPISDRDVSSRAMWRRNLAVAVVESCDCRILVRGKSTIVIGQKSDVEAARLLFEILSATVNRLADEGWRARRTIGDAAGWKKSFRLGAVKVIHDRLESSRRNAVTELVQEQAIVLASRKQAVNEWVNTHLNVRETTPPPKLDVPDVSGLVAGMLAGHRVDLDGKTRTRPCLSSSAAH